MENPSVVFLSWLWVLCGSVANLNFFKFGSHPFSHPTSQKI